MKSEISKYFEHYKIFAHTILSGHEFIGNVFAIEKED